MSFTTAGLFLESLTDDRGNALKLTQFTLTDPANDNAPVTTYTDATNTMVHTGLLYTDADGNACFYADPGIYTLTVPSTGKSFLVQVNVNSVDINTTVDPNVLHKTGAETVIGSKDFTGGLTKNGAAVATTTQLSTKQDQIKQLHGLTDDLSVLAPGEPWIDLDDPYGAPVFGQIAGTVQDAGEARALFVQKRSRVDVMDFGAAGDGAHDDASSITAAISACSAAGGGIVYLPAGRYRLTSSIVPMNNVTLQGAGRGATVLLPYGTAAAVKLLASGGAPLTDAHFCDFTIDGSNQTGSYTTAIKGIYITYNLRCSFERLHIHDTGATGLGIDFLDNCTIRDVTAENCGRLNNGSQPGGAGIGIGTGQWAIEATDIIGCKTRGNKLAGLFFESQTGLLPTGYRVIGHLSDGNGGHGIGDAGCRGLVVVGGTSSHNGLSGFAVYNGTVPAAVNGCDGIVIGLNCSSNTENGFHVNASNSSQVGEGRYAFQGCKGRTNTKHGFLVQMAASGDLNGITISECEGYANGRTGLEVVSAGGTVSDLNVTRNHFCNNGTDSSSSTREGIRVFNSLVRPRIQQNQCFDNQGTPTQLYGIQIDPSTTITNGMITDNECRGNASGQINVSSVTFASTRVERNIGYNPQGPTSVSVTASPMTYTSGKSREVLYLIGGTISNVVKSGTSIGTPNSVALEAYESVTITYSSAPTMVADRR